LCAAQNALDIATHLVTSAGHDAADYATALEELGRLGGLSPDFVAVFRGIAGFRNETRLFATATGGAFIPDGLLITGGFGIGSARVLASVSKRINCSAWLSGISAGMTSLSVIKKSTQKGQ
jgi:hypothetical protein